LVLILGGGLFLLLAFVHFCDISKIAHRETKTMTAVELCRLKDYQSASPWIAYTFVGSKLTNLIVKRPRLGHGGDVKAHCLLVRTGERWLVATVAPGFEGNTLVGRLLPIDSPSSRVFIEESRKLELNPSDLLPYEFNAVDGSASDQRLRYLTAAFVALFGLPCLLFGLHLFRGKRLSFA
jgi:hypothetical protein